MCEKSDLSNSIKLAIGCHVDAENVPVIMAIIDSQLANYEIKKMATEVATVDDSNYNLIKMYLSSLLVSGRREQTVKAYKYRLDDFASFIRKSLIEVSAFDVQNYLGNSLLRGSSKSYIQTIRWELAAFYKWMVKRKFVTYNPLEEIDSIKFQPIKEDPFSKTEISMIRDSITDSRKRAMVEFLIATGVRVGELINIKISNIDFQSLDVDVVNGKGGKNRKVYMTPLCASYLKAYIKEYGEEEYLFYAIKGNKGEPLSTTRVRLILKEIEKESGVENIHPHRFRHTAASELASSGMFVQEVQTLLGHTNIETTMKYVTVGQNAVRSSYMKYAY